MGTPFNTAALFLIETIFDLYIMAIILRLLLQLVRADFFNPLSQFIIKITNPILIPLRRIIPGFGGIDLAAVILILVIAMLKLSLMLYLQLQTLPHIAGLVLWSLGEILTLTINIYFYAILITIILSWLSPGRINPILSVLYNLTEPVMLPFRRIIPPIAGLDISPIFVMIMLKLIVILLADPMITHGSLIAARGY